LQTVADRCIVYQATIGDLAVWASYKSFGGNHVASAMGGRVRRRFSFNSFVGPI
jgi:hypothetical protein